jgi:flagellar biosynthetic protein FliR
MLALILLPVVPVTAESLPNTATGLVIFIGSEFLFGAVLAFFASFIFAATEVAGQMVSISMGMGMAGALDPQFGTQVSLVGYVWNILAILIFLSLDGHHIFFKILGDSYNWLHPGTIHITDATYRGILKGISDNGPGGGGSLFFPCGYGNHRQNRTADSCHDSSNADEYCHRIYFYAVVSGIFAAPVH